jgi:hypothetical protein
MDRRHQKRQISEHRGHLRDLRRGEADTAEQVAKSQEAIEDSLALLRRNDWMEVAEKPEMRRRPSEGHGPDRAAPEKTRPSRSSTDTQGRGTTMRDPGRRIALSPCPAYLLPARHTFFPSPAISNGRRWLRDWSRSRLSTGKGAARGAIPAVTFARGSPELCRQPSQVRGRGASFSV